MLITCEWCKQTVERAAKRRFCSPLCLKQSMQLPERPCPVCQVMFRPEKSKQKCCSLACYNSTSAKARTAPEPDPVPGARWIPLTQGKFALVDESLHSTISQYNWCAVKVGGDRFYAKRVIYKDGEAISLHMHNFILNTPKGFMCDHRNGDGLDNRGQNLRIVNQAQNSTNTTERGSSGYKGVYALKDGRYQAKLIKDGHLIYGGRFDTAEEAAKKYDELAREHHGQFGRYNFPRPGERSAKKAED